MVKEGRAQYADPCSMIKASALLLRHIGYLDDAEKIEKALDITTQYEKKLVMTGRSDGATGEAFTHYILGWMNDNTLMSTWASYARTS